VSNLFLVNVTLCQFAVSFWTKHVGRCGNLSVEYFLKRRFEISKNN
jgi:hypothetical protein